MSGGRRSKPPRFVRRGRPEDRIYEIEVPFTEDERALVERDAAALGLSLEDYILMRALDHGEVKGNA